MIPVSVGSSAGRLAVGSHGDSHPKLRTHYPPKVVDLVRKVRPTSPGSVWSQRAMSSNSLFSQKISLTIAMMIIGGNRAAIHGSLRLVSLQ
eukprot:2167523-Amphidinium_carterae.2